MAINRRMEYYSSIKKWHNANCSSMDGTRDHQTEWSNLDRGRQTLDDIPYVWNLKYDTNGFIYKTETDSQTQNTNSWIPEEKKDRKESIRSLGSSDIHCYM